MLKRAIFILTAMMCACDGGESSVDGPVCADVWNAAMDECGAVEDEEQADCVYDVRARELDGMADEDAAATLAAVRAPCMFGVTRDPSCEDTVQVCADSGVLDGVGL